MWFRRGKRSEQSFDAASKKIVVKICREWLKPLVTLFADNDCSRFTSRICAQVLVCGSDGVTYPTPCALEEANCKSRKKGLAPIKRVENGQCGSAGIKGQSSALI